MDSQRISSADGTGLRFCRWPRESATGTILIVPGLAEHAGRYGHVADALGTAGWSVGLIELRGHGESEGKRGHVSRWIEYVEDLKAALSATGGPVVLLGHSMGGLVVLDALAAGLPDGQVRGVVVSDPNLEVAVVAPRAKIAAAKVLSKLLPSLSLANEIPASHISRDPEVVRKYEADPLVFRTITPRWYTEMLLAQERAKAAASRMKLPLLALVGEGDRICNPRATVAFAESWGGPKQTKRYPGLYHEVLNEPEKAAVLADLVGWLGTLPSA